MDNKPLTPPAITNVVVVMLENRSYDNVLGWLDEHAGAVPNLDSHGNSYAAHNAAMTAVGRNALRYPGTGIPVNDPSEKFGSMAQQFLGLADIPNKAPYKDYTSRSAPMTGFVMNYEKARKAPTDRLPDVMNYFTGEQLPVTQFLARNYGVCDRWFASAPTQTFTNRVFALCAAPAGPVQGRADRQSVRGDPPRFAAPRRQGSHAARFQRFP